MALALRCPAAASPSPSPARAPFPNSSSAHHSQPPRRPGGGGGCRCHYYGGDGAGRGSYDRVPEQFREENLKDGRSSTFTGLVADFVATPVQPHFLRDAALFLTSTAPLPLPPYEPTTGAPHPLTLVTDSQLPSTSSLITGGKHQAINGSSHNNGPFKP